MVKTMANQEMITAHNALVALQNVEKETFEKKGQRLLKGRVKISYAVNKNISALQCALKPYQDTLNKLDDEMRDKDAEKTAIDKAKENGENLNDIEMIFREGFSAEDYIAKRNELLAIENEVDIHEIDIELFDGIELNSAEIGLLMFMLHD